MKIYCYIPVILVLLIGCNSEPQKSRKTADEDQLIARLSDDFFANPSTQPEIDQNLILNYAIDNLLDVKALPSSGIYYQILAEGEGKKAAMGDRLTANYRGMLLNKKEFDSSYRTGRPLEFDLGRMIKGWQLAVPLLKPGGKGIFLIPSHLAYGTSGYSDLIPPNAPLIFEIELIDIR